MATVNKNFKIKSGLVVEGTTGTINGEDILTKAQADIDYIINEVGGSGVSTNTPDTLVLRDGSGNFAAGTITADLTGDVTGTVSDISNHTTDSLTEGTSNQYYTDAKVRDVLTGATKTNISITKVGNELHITAENGVGDSTTDDLTEGTSNKYYADSLVDAHLSGGNAITYSAGQISVDINENGGLTNPNDALSIDRTTVDTWYDASGAAADVATDLSTHETATTSIHGVTGNIVGTSDAQRISNKTVSDALYFGYDNSNPSTIQGEIDGAGDLTVTAGSDLNLTATAGDIILNPDGAAYVGSATAGNEVATHSYVDNAVSGLSWKQAVNLKVTSNVNLADAAGTYDGHAVDSTDVGYRFLLTDQNTASENGIYVGSENAGKLVLTRAEDADAYTELVGAAVYVMEGTQFGATSWVQGDHYLTSFSGQDWTQFSGQGSVTAGYGIDVNGLEVAVDSAVIASQSDLSTGLGGKQDTLTAGTNIDITNNTVSVTGLSSTDISDFSTAALSATASAYDASGAASTAETNANSYTNTALESYTATANLESTIDFYGFAYTSELPTSTDDVPEGVTNHYYTDARAKAEAAALLTNATLSNITITADGSNNLTITAENGVAGSTTDDLTEGNSNLYFTDQRALTAVSGSDIAPQSVEINNYRLEEATRVSAGSTATVNLHSFQYPWESAKYLIRVVGWVGGVKHSQLSEILMTVDGNNNIAMTEYGTTSTNDSSLASFSATEASQVYTLTATVNGATSCEIVTAATLLSWAD